MKVRRPFTKTRSGKPQLKIGGATIKVDYSDLPSRGGAWGNRMAYAITIGKKTYKGDDLDNVRNLRTGFETLLSFLDAAADSYSYEMRTGRPGDASEYFPPEVVEWAYQHADEIGMVRYEIIELGDDAIEE